MNKSINHTFPLEGQKAVIFILSLAAALLMMALSGLGLAFPVGVYPSQKIAETFLANDLVNIIVGLPLFLVSLIYFRREKLLGLLILPGALIYVAYNYFAYLLGQPFSWFSALYLLLIVLSGYSLFQLLGSMDHQAVKEKLEGGVVERLTGWVLVSFGLAFIALALSEIIPGILDGSIPPLGEKAVSVADILVSIGWVIGGVMLLRRRAPGYSLGLGLLLAASSLFIGLILFFFFAPLLTGRDFDWIEVLTVFGMGMICFVPTFLFYRGVIRFKQEGTVA
ncbi:MAG: hypothetical protein DRI46_06075 [Chloroflexi bacterium]|nr:MAG: hypothetical protein DRI46_06075 [Chloroflexota bacterium]